MIRPEIEIFEVVDVVTASTPTTTKRTISLPVVPIEEGDF